MNDDVLDKVITLTRAVDCLDKKIDEILKLLRPVSAYADFVDDLKNVFNSSSILKSLGITRVNLIDKY